MGMNCDLIISRSNGACIVQGCASTAHAAIAREDSLGFDMVVLCAYEVQIEQLGQPVNPDLQIVSAPNGDDKLSRSQAVIATNAARRVAAAYADRRSVLVTCKEGRNRSGLVTALALHMIYGVSGRVAVDAVKDRRKGAHALTNRNFVKFLERIPSAVRVPNRGSCDRIHRKS